jgi:hypothetical protein
MRIVCLFLVLFRLATDPAFGQSGASRRPNIVWLIGENIDHDLGCYGQQLVRTPNLDRLAAEGVRYLLVFATSPVRLWRARTD